MNVGDIVYTPEGNRAVVVDTSGNYAYGVYHVKVRLNRNDGRGVLELSFPEDKLERAEVAAERFRTSLELIANRPDAKGSDLAAEAAATLGREVRYAAKDEHVDA